MGWKWGDKSIIRSIIKEHPVPSVRENAKYWKSISSRNIFFSNTTVLVAATKLSYVVCYKPSKNDENMKCTVSYVIILFYVLDDSLLI